MIITFEETLESTAQVQAIPSLDSVVASTLRSIGSFDLKAQLLTLPIKDSLWLAKLINQ